MSHDPDPSQELARQVGERLAANPAVMEGFRCLTAELAALQNTQRAQLFRFGEYCARVLAPALQAHNEQVSSAMNSWAARLVRNMAVHSPQFQFDVSRLDIDAVLASPFDALPAQQREWARHVVGEATARVDLDAPELDDVPDEMLDELSQAARAFADGQPATLSWETKRILFVWFWGVLVFLALMQAQVQNKAAKELMEDAAAATPYVAATMAAASAAWKRAQPNPGQEEGNEHEEAPGT
ncbi:hypothetical protein [Streptomyces tubercidicus]